MNVREHLTMVKCCLIVQVGFGLVAGCASQETRESQATRGQAKAENVSHKSSKTIVAAERVPDAVKQALQVKYPAVHRAEWKIKPDGVYEAEFIRDGAEITVMFDAAGKWLETESAIDPAKVPGAVSGTAARLFSGSKVVETQSVERWDEAGLTYELHLENAREIAKVRFSNEGVILNRSAKVKP
jgi:hypothetical protein